MSYLIFLLTLLLRSCVFANYTGLTLQVIHPNSPESPYYTKNLSRSEYIETLVSQSIAQAHFLTSSIAQNSTGHVEWLRPETRLLSGPTFLVKLGVGTFRISNYHRNYFLSMHTSSDLIWLQCESCKTSSSGCFPQREAPFFNTHSESYHPLPCGNHEFCFPGMCSSSGFCTYSESYGGGQFSTSGILASETLTFASERTYQDEKIPQLVFGCGSQYAGTFFENEAAGVLGLGWGSRSFISQVESKIDGRFSYCFPHFDDTAQGMPSYLKFGADIVTSSLEHYGKTTLRRVKDHKYYYVNLVGISVQDKRLNIPTTMFNIKNDGAGGTIIDTGSFYTQLVRPAYEEVESAVRTYVSALRNYKRINLPINPFTVCYGRVRDGPDGQLPTVTFHFDGVDLTIPSRNVFTHISGNRYDTICLAMLPMDKDFSILGAYQQSNIRFIYDRRGMVLHFKPDTCT